MKVSYIVMEFPSPSETFASNDVRVLLNCGVQVNVYAMKNKNINHDKMISERCLQGVQISNCGVMQYLVGLLYALSSPLLFLPLLAWIVKHDWKRPRDSFKMILLVPSAFFIFENIRKNRPDVVHLFWGHYPSIVGFLVDRKLPQIKLSIFLGAYDLRHALGVSREIAANSNFVFTHSHANADRLVNFLKIDPTTINVVHRGIDITGIYGLSSTAYRPRTGVILAAGRLLKFKRFDAVITLFSQLFRLGLADKLIIAGDGPERDHLEKKSSQLGCGDSVVFTGHITQNELFELMKKADFFFHFSLFEHIPNVVKEAMLLGALCVVTRSDGIEELVDNNVSGFIFEKDDYMDAVDIFYFSDKKMTTIKNAAREIITESFDVRVSMAKYISIWKKAKG